MSLSTRLVRMELLLCSMLAWLTCYSTAAAGVFHSDPVNSGARGLSRGPNFPWYNEDKDDLAPIHPPTAEEFNSSRNSNWQELNKPPAAPSAFWTNFFANVAGFFKFLGWTLLTLLLVSVILILGWAYLRLEGLKAGVAGKQTTTTTTENIESQIENLPFPLDPTETNLLAEARRSYQTGNYKRAAIYYYSYLLVQLDEHQLIHLARGKTNRQYLRELRNQPAIRSLFEDCMILFEDAFFGDHEITRERFEHCWSRLEEFQTFLRVHLEQAAA